jgi:hypothetical protein
MRDEMIPRRARLCWPDKPNPYVVLRAPILGDAHRAYSTRLLQRFCLICAGLSFGPYVCNLEDLRTGVL